MVGMASSGGSRSSSAAAPGAYADASIPEWPLSPGPFHLVSSVDAAASGNDQPPRLVVNETARKAFLRAVEQSTVRSIAVCGLYRTGKSLLMNLLSGAQGSVSRFEVGDSVRACTVGIWARVSSPMADGSICLLLDCEGTGNTERSKDHDARLFALAVLISSMVIFNSKGVISDPSVNALATATSLAQHIRQSQRDTEAMSRLAPAFLWVLRDFALILEDAAGEPISENQYLEQMLGKFAGGARPPSEAMAAARWSAQREARQRLMELFPQRDCITLVRPVEEEEQLQRLGQLQLRDMRPKFAAQVEDLQRRTFRASKVLKSPGGDAVTGGAFMALLEAHVEALNSGTLPQLGSAWQQVSRQECGRAVEEALRVFSAASLELTSTLPVREEELEEAIRSGADVARGRFEEVALGGAEARQEYEADLETSLEEASARLRKNNESSAERHNETWLQREFGSLVDDLLKQYRPRHEVGDFTIEECDKVEVQLTGALAHLRVAFDLQATGPTGPTREAVFTRCTGTRVRAARTELAEWRARAGASAEAKAAALKAQAAAKVEAQKLAAEITARTAKQAEQLKKSKERSGVVGAAQAQPSPAPPARGGGVPKGRQIVGGVDEVPLGAHDCGPQPACCTVQ